MNRERIKILYIAGSGRSGTTILSKILGQVQGFFFGGELCNVWKYGLLENRMCGCGALFRSCPFWQAVFQQAFGGMEELRPQEMYELRKKSASMRHIPLFMLPGWDSRKSRRIREFSGYLEKLYSAIRMQAESSVIVDCSKSVSYGYLLGSMESIDLHVVQIIRDPRGVAHEKLKRKRYQPGGEKPVYAGRYGLLESSFTWDVQNAAAEFFWKGFREKYLKIRYEDFAAHPRETVESILRLLGKEGSAVPFVEERKVSLTAVDHSAAGNPVRFNNGMVEIKPDVEWVTEMGFRNKSIVTSITWPLLIKYGYMKRHGGANR